MKLNLLVLGGGRRVSLYERLLKSSTDFGITLKIFSAELSLAQPVDFLSTVLQSPKWDDPQFKKWLFRVIDQYEINAILPLMDAGVTKLAEFSEYICKNGTTSFVGEMQYAKMFENKKKLKEYCYRENIKTIRNSAGTFPKLIKPAFGFGGNGHIVINNKDQLSYELNRLKSDHFIVEDYITGMQEYTVDGYITKDGQGYFSPRRRLQISGGEAIRSVTECTHALIELCKRIFSSIKWRGPVTLQFFKTKDNEFILIEVNGRFGGGVINSMQAGLRLDKLLFADYLNTSLSINELKADAGLIMMRANSEYWSWE